MSENDEIVQILTDIRTAQREHLEEYKQYLVEAREHNRIVREGMEKARQWFREKQQIAISQQREAVAATRVLVFAVSFGIIVWLLWVFFGGH